MFRFRFKIIVKRYKFSESGFLQKGGEKVKKASPVMICLMVALVIYGFAAITVCQADNAKPYSPQPVEPLDNAKPY
jgi:hypothetical protein